MIDIIDYLFKVSTSLGINFEAIYEAPDFPSISFHKANKMYINLNWKNQWEIPFIIGHEMGHLVNGDIGTWEYQSGPSSKGSKEHNADIFSLKMIFDYAMNQIDAPSEPCDFIDQFGIPAWMYDDTMILFKKKKLDRKIR